MENFSFKINIILLLSFLAVLIQIVSIIDVHNTRRLRDHQMTEILKQLEESNQHYKEILDHEKDQDDRINNKGSK